MTPAPLHKEIAPRSRRWRPLLLGASLVLSALIGAMVQFAATPVRVLVVPRAVHHAPHAHGTYGRHVAARVDRAPARPPARPALGPPACIEHVARATVDRAVADWWNAGSLDAPDKRARIVPAFEDGQPVGFKLYAILPGSPLALVGLHDGDTIRRIDGVDIASPETALGVYRRLTTGRFEHVTLELTRKGCPVVLLVSLA